MAEPSTDLHPCNFHACHLARAMRFAFLFREASCQPVCDARAALHVQFATSTWQPKRRRRCEPGRAADNSSQAGGGHVAPLL